MVDYVPITVSYNYAIGHNSTIKTRNIQEM